jgi:hypothetical protein
LAWTTRFRPVHIQALLLAGIAPKNDFDFLYAPDSSVGGEAATILEAVQLFREGKSREDMLADFQKLGLMLAYILECPLHDSGSPAQVRTLVEQHLPATIARIRHSLKPKRVLLISAGLQDLAIELPSASLGCPVFPPRGSAFMAAAAPTQSDFQAFRDTLAGSLQNPASRD